MIYYWTHSSCLTLISTSHTKKTPKPTVTVSTSVWTIWTITPIQIQTLPTPRRTQPAPTPGRYTATNWCTPCKSRNSNWTSCAWPAARCPAAAQRPWTTRRTRAARGPPALTSGASWSATRSPTSRLCCSPAACRVSAAVLSCATRMRSRFTLKPCLSKTTETRLVIWYVICQSEGINVN